MKKIKGIVTGALAVVAAVGFGVLLYWGVGKLEQKKETMPNEAVRSKEQPILQPKDFIVSLGAAGELPAYKPPALPEKPESVITSKTPSKYNDILSPKVLDLLQEDNRTPVKVKGIYVSGPKAGSSGMEDLIALVDETELNAMVIDIKNDSGEITYKMDLLLANEIGAPKGYIQDINRLVSRLKEKNIYLIARIVAFKDPILAQNKKEFSIKNKDGTIFKDKDGLAWVNPYNRGVWKYLVDVAKEAARVGFDEIQFDYIRFSTDRGMKNVDFGKEAVTMTKQEAINGFTSYAYEELMPLGVYVSADVYGAIIDSKTDEDIVGQNYYQMASGLDYISPMIYPSHYADGAYQIDYPDTRPYELITAALHDSSKVLMENPSIHQASVRPWLQDFTATWLTHHIKYDKEAVKAQIKAVYDAGCEEWILWNGSNRYTKDALDESH